MIKSLATEGSQSSIIQPQVGIIISLVPIRLHYPRQMSMIMPFAHVGGEAGFGVFLVVGELGYFAGLFPFFELVAESAAQDKLCDFFETVALVRLRRGHRCGVGEEVADPAVLI